ncbi:hypothetical protein OEK97_28080, partial [Escherichia coli]|uniref:hypothetical protein n=1 Tax=Escherichia coli TaxID=562 RepID=UPI0021D7D32C
MKVKSMTLQEIGVLNSTKIKGAISGKKGLQVVLEEVSKHIYEHGDYTVATTVINSWKDAEVNLTHEALAGIKWFVKYTG